MYYWKNLQKIRLIKIFDVEERLMVTEEFDETYNITLKFTKNIDQLCSVLTVVVQTYTKLCARFVFITTCLQLVPYGSFPSRDLLVNG